MSSSFRNHLSHRCPKNPHRVENGEQKILTFEAKKEGEEGRGNLIIVQFNKEVCKKAVAKYIVLYEFPFRHVENKEFRELVNILQPKYVLPSCIIIARDIFQFYLDE